MNWIDVFRFGFNISEPLTAGCCEFIIRSVY